MGHRLVRIPVAQWRALAGWCWERDQQAQLPQLARLATADLPAQLDAAAVRELRAELLAWPRGLCPPDVTAALDALLPFLETAIEVVDAYAGKPYTVTIVFQPEYVVPETERDSLFAVVSREERRRLYNLFGGIKSLDDAIQVLGPPDDDSTPVVTKKEPETEEAAPALQRIPALRTLTYRRLSEAAEVRIMDFGDTFLVQLYGKYVGPPEEPPRRGKLGAGWGGSWPARK
jgi:hypothetical protein